MYRPPVSFKATLGEASLVVRHSLVAALDLMSNVTAT